MRLHAFDFAENKGFLQKGQLIPLVGTPASLAFATRKPVLRHRPDFEEFPAPIMKEAYAKGLKSGCAVPLLCHEKIVGSMMLASLRESAFTEDDADLLAQIGAQVAIAVDNVPSTSRAPGAPNRVAAAPYGVVGAVAALWIMGTPFGFMAFLGVASLIGVIVSHVIVLFDFIEEKHEEGEPFEEAVIDAGIIRLRPVMITVGATVLALFPLALHGGPLWQPLCYTQIGGLAVATFITLLLVPVLYAIFVMDLKILKWETKEKQSPPGIAQVTDIAEHTAATA